MEGEKKEEKKRKKKEENDGRKAVLSSETMESREMKIGAMVWVGGQGGDITEYINWARLGPFLP